MCALVDQPTIPATNTNQGDLNQDCGDPTPSNDVLQLPPRQQVIHPFSVRAMIGDRYLTSDACPVVLCIDDDPEVSEAIALRLRQYKVSVLRAFHGMHGLWLAMNCRPDLIITDLKMPQGEGSYIIERLRNHSDTCGLPIIVLTGQRNPQLEITVRLLGAEHVLTKPVHFDELAAAIRTFVPLNVNDSDELIAAL
ncbi:MAG: response regulator, partial [Pirellulales bacterium]